MRLIRWGVLVALLGFLGCDVGTATVFLLQSRDKKSDSGPESAPPVPGFGPIFQAWVAQIPDAGAADTARQDLVDSNGNPTGPLWTLIGNAAATFIFDPDPSITFNAILIQVSSTLNYDLDCVEVLDNQDHVLEHASGITWSNLVDLPDNIVGPPDGVVAHTNAIDFTNAFIFTLYPASPAIDRFRINGHGDTLPPDPGDVESVGGFTSASNERPGGVAIDTAGKIHLTLAVGNTVRLARYDLTGAFVDDVQIATGITAAAGSHSVALDQSDVIYTATTVSNGQVLVRQYAAANLAQGWSTTFNSGLGSDRVESNGIAVDQLGNVVVAGGMNSLTGLNHWLARLTGSNGGVLFDQRPGLDLTGPTYWHGVTTDAGNLIFATGDLTSALSSQVDVQTARYNTAGTNQWQDQFGAGGNPNLGNAIAVAGSGKVYVGGFLSTTGQGRNSFIISYAPAAPPLPGNPLFFADVDIYNGSANSNDEILDVAVDSDGFVYAVGYETVTGQGENFWVRKYTSDLTEVWTRTYDGGVGNDRAISVAVFDTHVIVAGFQTVTGGQTKLLLRVYAK